MQTAIAVFATVDQAIIFAILPNRTETGRYMAVVAFAQKIPSAVAPLIASLVITHRRHRRGEELHAPVPRRRRLCPAGRARDRAQGQVSPLDACPTSRKKDHPWAKRPTIWPSTAAETSSPSRGLPPGSRGRFPPTLPRSLTSSKRPSTAYCSRPRRRASACTSLGRGRRCAAGSGSGGGSGPRHTDATWSAWSGFRSRTARRGLDRLVDFPGRSREDPGYGRRPAHVLATEFDLAGRREVGPAVRHRPRRLHGGASTANATGTAELSPGSTSYDRTLYAQASDVTSSLRPGRNRVDIELSDGWYRGQVGAFRLPAGWGTTLGARAELHIELGDGTRQVIRQRTATGRARPSTTTRADLMDGQTVDFAAPAARRRRKCSSDVVDAPPIDWSPAPPVRVIESRPPASRPRGQADGVWVADFGQNASGWIRLEDLGAEGTRTVIEYGEHLGRDGDLSTSHLDSHRPGEPARIFSQRDEVIAGAPARVFEPRHTVHGFQYARISRTGTGLGPRRRSTMQVVHTDLRAYRRIRVQRRRSQPPAQHRANGASSATRWTCPPTARPANGWRGRATTRCSSPPPRGSEGRARLQPEMAEVGARRPARRRPDRQLLPRRPPHQEPPR